MPLYLVTLARPHKAVLPPQSGAGADLAAITCFIKAVRAELALVPFHPRLALALSIIEALEVGGALGVTVAIKTRLPPVNVVARGNVVVGLMGNKKNYIQVSKTTYI